MGGSLRADFDNSMGCVSCGAMIFQLSDCKPFAAYWNKRLYVSGPLEVGVALG